MLPDTWQASLNCLLNQLTADSARFPRVAILGIGNCLRCDDAAGVLAARALIKQAASRENILILEAGPAPENSTGRLREFAPDLVIFLDAAQMGLPPGAIRWIPDESIDGMSASTHGLPLPILARYLSLDLRCQVVMLGIQAASNEVGECVSPEVLQAVDEVVHGLVEIFRFGMIPTLQA